MKIPKEGTEKWFEHARHQCVDHLRALDSIRLAHEYITTILARWDTEDITTQAGLHSASVIAYARPFTPTPTKKGKVTYPTSALKKASQFDHELHLHLLNLRNRLIAHADYGVLAPTMYVQAVGDERLPVVIGVNVKSMFGIEARALAERYQSHFLACMASIEETLNLELREVATQAQLHPVEFNATHNIPESKLEAKVTKELQKIPGPTGPASDVKEPSFPEGLSGYRYLTLRHERALIEDGTYTIHDGGVPKEIIFAVRTTSYGKKMALAKVTLTVPPIAPKVYFAWEITPADGRVRLFRTRNDLNPQMLNGPSGKGSSELVEPATLYYEMLPGTTTFRLLTTGYDNPGNFS